MAAILDLLKYLYLSQLKSELPQIFFLRSPPTQYMDFKLFRTLNEIIQDGRKEGKKERGKEGEKEKP